MTSEASPRKRVRLDKDERRAQILGVAQRLFQEREYNEVSVSDIAEAAGVARGLLHHYFASKRDLYLEVVRSVAVVPDLPVPVDSSTLDESEMWAASVDALVHLASSNRERWVQTFGTGGIDVDDDVASIIDSSREIVAEQTIAALGLADQDSPTVRALVRAYGGLVQEVTMEWLVRERLTEAEAREIIHATMPLLLEHVLPRLRDRREP